MLFEAGLPKTKVLVVRRTTLPGHMVYLLTKLTRDRSKTDLAHKTALN